MLKEVSSFFTLLAALPAFVLAAVFPPGPSVSDLQAKYQNGEVSVLIVPGHDNRQPGTSYKGVREADLVLGIAQELEAFLLKDPRIKVLVSRDDSGDHAPWLLEYIEEYGKEILSWRKAARANAQQLMAIGTFVPVSGVGHNNAPSDTVTYLYAINHYANENDVDIVLHLHVNDEHRPIRSKAGKSTGYALYVPEPQLSGSATARRLATSIAAELDTTAATSTLRQESDGVVDEQELIAIGPWGTRNGPSVLIEYGYIYEPKFVNAKTRKQNLRQMAEQTSAGILRFLNPDYSK